MNYVTPEQQKKNRAAGFTLVEVLVALTIFSLAVTGVITVADKGGLTTITIKNRVTAAYLADEGIELMRALRDTTMDAQPPNTSITDYYWQNSFLSLPIFTSACTPTVPCDINVLGHGNTGYEDNATPFPTSADVIPCPSTGCPLYYDNRTAGGIPIAVSYGYYLDNNGSISGSPLSPSGFTRALTVTFTPEPSGASVAWDEEAKVTSTVTWHEGSTLQSLTQTEFLYDWY